MADKNITQEELDLAEEFLTSLRDDMLKIFDDEKMNATGESRRMISVEMRANGGSLYAPSHLNALERGRGPSKSRGGNLWAQISDWVLAKGIVAKPDPVTGRVPSFDSLVFLITRAIHAKGTVRHQKQEKSGIVSKVLTEDRFDDYLVKAADFASEYAAAAIFKEFKFD